MRALRERAWQWPGQASLHVLYGVPAARASTAVPRQDGVPWMCAVQFPASRALRHGWWTTRQRGRWRRGRFWREKRRRGQGAGARPKPERSDRWSRRWRVAVGAIRRQRCRRVEQHVLQMWAVGPLRCRLPQCLTLVRWRTGHAAATVLRRAACTRVHVLITLIWIDRPRGGFTRAPSPARRRAVPPHPSTPGTARGG